VKGIRTDASSYLVIAHWNHHAYVAGVMLCELLRVPAGKKSTSLSMTAAPLAVTCV
jgi:hypothetical protein